MLFIYLFYFPNNDEEQWRNVFYAEWWSTRDRGHTHPADPVGVEAEKVKTAMHDHVKSVRAQPSYLLRQRGWLAGWVGGWLAVRHSRYCIKTTKPTVS